MSSWRIAIVGVTGAVGGVLLERLLSRQFPMARCDLLASERSAGQHLTVADQNFEVQALSHFDFSKTDIAFFTAGAKVSKAYVPKATQSGAIVIDNTSCFRYQDDVPLVVPEVNATQIAHCQNRRIIANPNCSTIQMCVALNPIHQVAKLARINVATYQSVSGSGRAAMNALKEQSQQVLNHQPLSAGVYDKPIAFNVLPHIDNFMDNGYTREEMKMVWETQKIFADDSIKVNPTCVRVPVLKGHAEAIHCETRKKITPSKVRELLGQSEGVTVFDDPNSCQYPTPLTEAAENDSVFVGRIREDLSCERGINLWVVADNLLKGAALNSVQIAEVLVKDYL